MTTSITHPPTASERDQAPPDIGTMRATARRALAEASVDELDTLALTLRGHVQLLIPEVEQLAARLPESDVPRYCALACVGEARGKLGARPGMGPDGAVAYARKLARTLGALCDHFEALTGQGMCVACDQPMRATDETVPYDRVSGSGGAVTSRIHAWCAKHPHPAD
ncbi:DUF6415 family natural product biosynthesis protein [Streptomyces sp. NPDC002676]